MMTMGLPDLGGRGTASETRNASLSLRKCAWHSQPIRGKEAQDKTRLHSVAQGCST